MKYNKILAALILLTVSSLSFAAPILVDSYDISNARVNGYGGWHHTYNGNIATTGSLSQYTNGSGTINDGLTGTSEQNTHLFATGDNSIVTLHLDSVSVIDSISLYSFLGGNGIPGNITGVNITIGGITEYITTTGFGGTQNSHANAHELLSLNGTTISTIMTDTITLSGFTTENPYAEYFSISEATVVAGIPVPTPAAFLLLIAGIIGLRLRKKA